MRFPTIYSMEELHQLILEVGFLPFFQNTIPGFSIEECIKKELWFSDIQDGPWEWKGPIIQMGDCVYGKLFKKKAGFVSLEWYPVLANYRRNGYDFDALYDDGMTSHKDKYVYDTIQKNETMLSGDLKKSCNYTKGGNKGFETVITRLQMQTYVCIDDFTYKIDRTGHRYGWGVANYTTPEEKYGRNLVCGCYDENPEDSRKRIVLHLKKILPEIDEKSILQMIG